MKIFYPLFLAFFLALMATGQEYNSDVESIINSINSDSLIQQLRNLSGEDEVVIDGSPTFITHRVSNWGNDLAAEYLFEKLESYGLATNYDPYSGSGTNVIAIKPGTVYPDSYYFICAHYDAVDYYCADDNASGTAAVLEAARLFSDINFEYSLIFALWDEEELGLIGSDDFATNANLNDIDIQGVINMDMISWDGDEDSRAEIHARLTADSDALADYMVEINDLYNLSLTTEVMLPGTGASDQGSFWSNNYASVLLIEEYYGGDFNPYYHTEEDRIAILDMDYFLEMSRLSIGTVASLASPDFDVSVSALENDLNFKLYPNPAQDVIYMKADYPLLEVSVFNTSGSLSLYLSKADQGGIDVSALPAGLYLFQIQTEKGSITKRVSIN